MARGTVNKVILLGRLGQDPDVRATASGTQVVNLNLATNEPGPKDGAGNTTYTTEWHRIVMFGRMAENAATYLRKGSQVYLEGRLQTRKWTDGNGVERYSTEVVAMDMQFVGGRSSGTGTAPAPAPLSAAAAAQQAPSPGNNMDDFDDDIPF